MLRVLMVVGLLMAHGMVSAGSLDASINDDSVNVTVGWVQNAKTPDPLQVQLGYMHNLQNNRLISAGLFVIGETGRSDNPLELGVGGKVTGIASDANGTLYGLSLGVELRYYPKFMNRLAFSGQYYYGPNVVVSRPATSFQELGLRIEYQLLPQAFAYIGYRDFQVSIENGTVDNIDSGASLGFRILFQ